MWQLERTQEYDAAADAAAYNAAESKVPHRHTAGGYN